MSTCHHGAGVLGHGRRALRPGYSLGHAYPAAYRPPAGAECGRAHERQYAASPADANGCALAGNILHAAGDAERGAERGAECHGDSITVPFAAHADAAADADAATHADARAAYAYRTAYGDGASVDDALSE